MKEAQLQSDSGMGCSTVVEVIKEWSTDETPTEPGRVKLLFVICMSGGHTECQTNVCVIFKDSLHFTRCISFRS